MTTNNSCSRIRYTAMNKEKKICICHNVPENLCPMNLLDRFDINVFHVTSGT